MPPPRNNRRGSSNRPSGNADQATIAPSNVLRRGHQPRGRSTVLSPRAGGPRPRPFDESEEEEDYSMQTIIHKLYPPGLVATVYPQYFHSAALGNLNHCFTFMKGFDDAFMGFLGVKALRPEDLGWTKMQTKEEWIRVVNDYFKPQLPDPPHCTPPPSVPALCFPLIQGATRYHWAVYNGTYWLEQDVYGGPINVWESLGGMVHNIYYRGDCGGKYYVEGSHFFFAKKQWDEEEDDV